METTLYDWAHHSSTILSVPNTPFSVDRQVLDLSIIPTFLCPRNRTLESVSLTSTSSFISRNSIYELNEGLIFSSLIHNRLDSCNHSGFTGLCHQPPLLAYPLWHRPAVLNILSSEILLSYRLIPVLRSPVFDFFPSKFHCSFSQLKIYIRSK